jgi:hypothetical protein
MREKLPTEDEQRATYSAQIKALGLKPWQEPPCVQDPNRHCRGTEDERVMMQLLRRMLEAGVSRWHHDPLTALAEAARRG